MNERQELLKRLTEAIELALGPEWIYIVIIAKPEDEESSNVAFNCSPEDFGRVMHEIMYRWEKSLRTQKLRK
jgi:hypothetical protein